MQGVVKIYDPATGTGSVLTDTDLKEIEFEKGEVSTSPFRFLRQGQRINFDVNDEGFAINLRLGSESDMRTPLLPPPGA